MRIVTVTPDNWEKYGRVLLQFVKRYERKAKKPNCYRWMYHLRKHHLVQRGNSIKLAFWDGKLVAVFAVVEYGTKESVLLIAPNYKETSIGSILLENMKSDLSVCYYKIPSDATAFIKAAIDAGYVAFRYAQEQGQTMLWFGGGHWHSSDIVDDEEFICENGG
ncbi:hypothetical protein [Alkalihalobacillus sp. LMS39]|uniref:hypothetical protein n=1 Tax=Alkalihalobacillus sp. LMS39 TaxID=2924032 RepID=UPI001FB3C94C|nr:hypothetical protein [Alkalihalobacillus sp. LMS39]UOE95468.1 hypothetical protein MM271_07615 [Alkalihalobacillus sp. LMS39]